jgi:drug/metabolite transporter (DMT)-like permease
MFGSYTQVAARAAVACIISLILVFYQKVKLDIPKNKRLQVLLFAISFPLSIVFFTLSVVSIKAANSVFMIYVGSLATAFLVGKLVYKESINLQKILALILALCGLIFFVYPFDIRTLGLGVVFGLVAGVFDGLTNSLRKSLGGINRSVLLVYQYGLGALIGLSGALFVGETLIKTFNPLSLLVLIIFGVCLTLIGNLLTYGFNHFDVNIGTVVLSTELFFALIVNYFFLKEVPLPKEIIGGIMIFVAANVMGVDWNQFRKMFKGFRLHV